MKINVSIEPRIRAFTIAVICSAGVLSAQTIVRVDPNNSSGLEDGLAWSTSYTSLDTALLWAAQQGNTAEKVIWVADGVYKPGIERMSGDAASKSFMIPPNTKLFGGFDGIGTNEQNLSDRNGALYTQTILEGQISSTVRARHVVFCQPQFEDGKRIEVDGFAIRSGFAVYNSTIPSESSGGGIYAQGTSLIVRNCKFSGNLALQDGAAIFWDNPGVPTGLGVTRSQFDGNVALRKGGAICAMSAGRMKGYGHPNQQAAGGPPSYIVNCAFDSNEAGRSKLWNEWNLQGGGAVYAFHPFILIDGSVFSNNEARGNGSAIKIEWEYFNGTMPPASSPLSSTNCTFYGNQVMEIPNNLPVGVTIDIGAGVFYSQPQPTSGSPEAPAIMNMSSAVVWSNTKHHQVPVLIPVGTTPLDNMYPASQFTVSYSDIEMLSGSVWPDPGLGSNINVDPQFQAPFLGDFRPSTTSPCRDTGSLNGSSWDIGDLDEDLMWGAEEVPFSVDLPGAFFKAHGQGVSRVLGGFLDRGAMEFQ